MQNRAREKEGTVLDGKRRLRAAQAGTAHQDVHAADAKRAALRRGDSGRGWRQQRQRQQWRRQRKRGR